MSTVVMEVHKGSLLGNHLSNYVIPPSKIHTYYKGKDSNL